jgi:hypothetical protein
VSGMLLVASHPTPQRSAPVAPQHSVICLSYHLACLLCLQMGRAPRLAGRAQMAWRTSRLARAVMLARWQSTSRWWLMSRLRSCSKAVPL